MERNKCEFIENKVEDYVREKKLLIPGASVVVGVSGGADSVCLLFLLCSLREKWKLHLKAVHVNHGIRTEAGEDQAFTEELCRRLGVDCEVVCADVPRLSKEWKCSEEEAGRRVRYEAFERVAQELTINPAANPAAQGDAEPDTSLIAVAHHADDNAETILFHMIRGTGLKGLVGMEPRRGKVIRPLLCLTREEIESYLQALGQTWVTDATNASDEYARNRIRHHILPEAEQIVRGATLHMNQLAAQLSEVEDFLEESVKALRYAACDSYDINVSKLLQGHVAVQKGLIRQLLLELSPGAKDIGAIHIEEVLELATREGNRTYELPFGLVARRSYDTIVRGGKESEHVAAGVREDALEQLLLLGDAEVMMEVFARDAFTGAPLQEIISEQKQYSKWLDYDKIGKPLSIKVRSREQGDYLYVAGPGGSLLRKSLKEYMINEKIPAGIRDCIPVVADGSRVIWLVGYRIGEDCKVTEATKEIAHLEMTRRKS